MSKFEYPNTYTVAGLTWVKSRFDLAMSNKDKYDYASFLLVEESQDPAQNAVDSWKGQPLKGWQIEGKATFAGVEVKLLKTWIIENKGQAWDQSWWDNAKAVNKYSDPLIKEWSYYYGYGLYRAWNQHLHNLGRKSGIIGITWAGCFSTGCFSNQFKSMYPSPIWEYIIANYDVLLTAQYPRNAGEIQYSTDSVKSLRNEYNYKGKIVHVLTKDFKESFFSWVFDSAIAQAEFNAVAPYVDVIVAYPGTGGNPEDYPPLLIKFQNEYGGSSNSNLPTCTVPSPTTITPSPTPAQPSYVTPTIYCLGSCVTLAPTQRPTQKPPTPTRTPNTSPAPTIDPCATVTPAVSANSANNEATHHKPKKSEGILQQLLELIKWLIEQILKLIGIQITPAPSTQPTQSISPRQPDNPTLPPCKPSPAPDATAPAISYISFSNISSADITISQNTNKTSNTQIEYGTTLFFLQKDG